MRAELKDLEIAQTDATKQFFILPKVGCAVHGIMNSIPEFGSRPHRDERKDRKRDITVIDIRRIYI